MGGDVPGLANCRHVLVLPRLTMTCVHRGGSVGSESPAGGAPSAAPAITADVDSCAELRVETGQLDSWQAGRNRS